MSEIGLPRLREAARRIGGYAHRTPVATCAAVDDWAGREIFFKCEQLQKVGAFKFRGACNAVLALEAERAARGVVTHSSGNHAQALALAARLRGIASHIVMPENVPPVKLRAVRGYGGQVVLCEPTLEAREATTERVRRETGATLVPPYDHPDIIAGQGTATLELLEEVPDLDVVVAPVGGGGLLAGTCIAAHGLRPRIRVIAGEPAGADDAARSLAAGRLVPQTAPDTIADGLLTSLGEITWPIIRDHVTSIETVSDAEIAVAMRFVWERAKQLIEPSAAVAVAALRAPGFAEAAGDARRVGVILSGGNVDFDRLPWSPGVAS
ncbi:MAG: pyridoxal-phosphate dependent enzyme [Myxococcota bacterium]